MPAALSLASTSHALAAGRVSNTRKPGMRQVAAVAGVAMSTVSRVMSGHPDVSPRMRERVLRVVADLGYTPDFLAQSLRRGATYSVGFSLTDISNPTIASRIVRGAEEVLRNAGYSLLLMNSKNDPELDAANVRFLHSRKVDGLIVSVAGEKKRATLAALAQLDVPIVVVDRDLPRRLRASAVLSEHRRGMQDAVGHLLDLEHRRVGLISLPADIRPGRERLAGLRAAYAARGLPPTFIFEGGWFSEEQSEALTLTLLDLSDAPTAIVVGHNQLLTGCLRAIVKRGLRLGQDLALVTCDDVPLAELFTPPIATISRDNVAMGRTAAELLLRRLNGNSNPEIVTHETHFEPRASCGPARNPAAKATSR
jgi:LacI family transcriptional regulator